MLIQDTQRPLRRRCWEEDHKSEKEMLADMQAGLSEKEFDQIARENLAVFLNV